MKRDECCYSPRAPNDICKGNPTKEPMQNSVVKQNYQQKIRLLQEHIPVHWPGVIVNSHAYIFIKYYLRGSGQTGIMMNYPCMYIQNGSGQNHQKFYLSVIYISLE